jgi:hypothetical protein
MRGDKSRLRTAIRFESFDTAWDYRLKVWGFIIELADLLGLVYSASGAKCVLEEGFLLPTPTPACTGFIILGVVYAIAHRARGQLLR